MRMDESAPRPLYGQRPTVAEINLDNLVHNLRVMQAAVGSEVAVMPALKADAYGHGAIECARALAEAGAPWFGVALPEEGAKLRAADIRQPILCLGGFWEGQEDFVIEERLTPVIFRLDLLDRLNRAAGRAGKRVAYHLKVDTGMGRLGVPLGELADFLKAAAKFEQLQMDGFLTHFAAADESQQATFTFEQMARFAEARRLLEGYGFAPRWIHQANSAAAHAYPSARGNLVRLGGVLYGLWRDSTRTDVAPLDWRPVLTWKTAIMLVKTVPAGTPLGYGCTFVTERESRIATLPVGYEDGLRRALSGRGEVLVRGKRAPIVGRVSMDLTLVDVTDVADATVGDEVVILGGQGDSRISAEAVAEELGAISYEITCGISDRVPRVYRNVIKEVL